MECSPVLKAFAGILVGLLAACDQSATVGETSADPERRGVANESTPAQLMLAEALAKDTDRGRRSQLFFSLGRASGATELVPDLLRVASDPGTEDDVATGAMRALGEVGGDTDESAIIDVLLGVMLNRARTSEVRVAAVEALGFCGMAPASGRRSDRVADVVRVMRDRDEPMQVRCAAMQALAPLGVCAGSAFEPLLEVVMDERSSRGMVFDAGSSAGMCGAATPENLERVMDMYESATGNAKNGLAFCMEGFLKRNGHLAKSHSARLRAIANETPNGWLRNEIERVLRR